MLATLLITLLVGVVVTTALLLSVGHRLRTASLGRSVMAVVLTAVVSGEVAARLFLLPSGYVRLSELAFIAVGVSVARRRRPGTPSAWCSLPP